MQIQLSNWGLRLGSLAVWIRLSIRVLDHLAMEGREKSFIRLQWLQEHDPFFSGDCWVRVRGENHETRSHCFSAP